MESVLKLDQVLDLLTVSVKRGDKLVSTQQINQAMDELRYYATQAEDSVSRINGFRARSSAELIKFDQISNPNEMQFAVLIRLRKIHRELEAFGS